MNNREQTKDTYNKSAAAFAKKFDESGVRASDIEESFQIIKKDNPKVLEIGCGNGRDAQEILKRTNDYLGIDISEEILKIAKDKVPEGNFQVSDIVNFIPTSGIDIVFAFASLIHINKEEFKKIVDDLYGAMNTGGIIRVSLKHRPSYTESTEESEFGIRTYYYYSEADLQELFKNYQTIKLEIINKRNANWIEAIFRK